MSREGQYEHRDVIKASLPPNNGEEPGEEQVEKGASIPLNEGEQLGEGHNGNVEVVEASVPLNDGEEPAVGQVENLEVVEASVEVAKRKPSLASKFKALSVDKPPTSSPLEFLAGLLPLCCCLPAAACACGCLILGILLQLIPLAKIIVGAYYWPGSEYCPKEQEIPLLLIIGGSIGILAGSVESIWGHQKIRERGGNKDGGKDPENQEGEDVGERDETPQKEAPCFIRCLSSLLRLATLAWFGYSAVVVYRSYPEVSYDKELENYCHPTLFRLLFWDVTITITLILLVPTVLCCACCVGGICFAATAIASDD